MKKILLLLIIFISISCYSQDRTKIRYVKNDCFNYTYSGCSSDTLANQDTLEKVYVISNPKYLIGTIMFLSLFDNIDNVSVEVYAKEFKDIRYKKINIDIKTESNLIFNTYTSPDLAGYRYFKIRYINKGNRVKLFSSKFSYRIGSVVKPNNLQQMYYDN